MLERVLETSDPFVVTLAKGTLEDAGIEFGIEGDDTDERNLSAVTPAGALPSKFLVAADFAGRARELLDPLIHPQAISEEDLSAEAESPEA